MEHHFIDIHAGGNPAIAGTYATVEEVLKELAAWGTEVSLRVQEVPKPVLEPRCEF